MSNACTCLVHYNEDPTCAENAVYLYHSVYLTTQLVKSSQDNMPVEYYTSHPLYQRTRSKSSVSHHFDVDSVVEIPDR